MPELPELEVVKYVLTRRLAGQTVVRVEVAPKGGPIVVRDLAGEGIAAQLAGRRLAAVERRGKYLLFLLAPRSAAEARLVMAVNPKLSGRLQLCLPQAPKAGPVHLTFHFAGMPEVLRYIDSKRMGQIYLTHDLAQIPTFAEMGPEALAITLDDFRQRLRPFRVYDGASEVHRAAIGRRAFGRGVRP